MNSCYFLISFRGTVDFSVNTHLVCGAAWAIVEIQFAVTAVICCMCLTC